MSINRHVSCRYLSSYTHIERDIYIYYTDILGHRQKKNAPVCKFRSEDVEDAADSWRSRHGTILRVAGVVHDSLEWPWVQHRMRGNSNNNSSNYIG